LTNRIENQLPHRDQYSVAVDTRLGWEFVGGEQVPWPIDVTIPPALLRDPGPTDETVPASSPVVVERSVGTSTLPVSSSRQMTPPAPETMEAIKSSTKEKESNGNPEGSPGRSARRCPGNRTPHEFA
jgi:hypothetical protein